MPASASRSFIAPPTIARNEKQLKAQLVPYSGEMICWPVSPRVGRVKKTIRRSSSRSF
jgi:hypothetical protein